MSDLGELRAIRDNELELMLSWRNSPGVRKNMYTRHEISLSEHLSWWSRTCERPDQKYLMYEKDSAPLGIVGFNCIDEINLNCSWAFYASPVAPRGTGSRMEFLALEFAFQQLSMHKIHCEVLEFNASVVKLHQKFGFKVEGILRNHHKFENDYVDILKLGLLRSEWMHGRGKMLAVLTGDRGGGR